MSTQKYFSTTAMVAYITFMNMFIPLSIDLYLPELPEMGDYFGAGKALISLTLTVFFVVFAVSIILFGPLSDTYGRRRVLIAGSVIYTIASIGCVCSPNIYILLAGRVFQALGAGAVLTVATALIKDCFRGPLMTRILAVTQALAVIAPMGAPIIGGFLLTFTDWRGAFVLLTVLGLVNLVLALLMTETLPMEKRYHGSMLRSLTLLWDFSSNRHFMTVLIMFSLLAAPYMAYLSVSSFVYIEFFGESAQAYSGFLAVNSAAAVVGPFLYLRLQSWVKQRTLTNFCFGAVIFSGILVLSVGHMAAVGFLLAFLPFTITESIIRPFGMDILLNEAKKNTGTASSMINFIQTLFGSAGMIAGTLPWGNFITGLGIIILAAAMGSIGIWCWLRRWEAAMPEQ